MAAGQVVVVWLACLLSFSASKKTTTHVQLNHEISSLHARPCNFFRANNNGQPGGGGTSKKCYFFFSGLVRTSLISTESAE